MNNNKKRERKKGLVTYYLIHMYYTYILTDAFLSYVTTFYKFNLCTHKSMSEKWSVKNPNYSVLWLLSAVIAVKKKKRQTHLL